MPRTAWITCCWPGLAQLWLRGQWRGLLIATSFAMVVNLNLAATLIWPEWLPARWCQAIWVGLAVTWLVMSIQSYSLVVSIQNLTTINEQPLSHTAKKNDYYVEAQTYYLQQSWFEAEQCLTKAIAANGHDVDALLMLASLYRHTGRIGEARQVLEHVATVERTDKWNWELVRETQLLDSFESTEHVDLDPATLATIDNHLMPGTA